MGYKGNIFHPLKHTIKHPDLNKSYNHNNSFSKKINIIKLLLN
jgi:hypothetical protein